MIDAREIAELQKPTLIKSLVIVWFEWTLIFLAFLLVFQFQHPTVYLMAVLFIGTRQLALYTQMHDASHFKLTASRVVNDLLGQVLLALPLFYSLHRFRTIHFAHHRHLKSEKDPEHGHSSYPEFQFPMTKKTFVLILLMDLSGFNYLRYKFLKLRAFTTSDLQKVFSKDSISIAALGFYPVLVLFLSYLNLWGYFLILWVAPYVTVYQALLRFRLYMEHFCIPQDNEYQTRTVITNVLERFFISPYNLSYHIEHHLYPGVPSYSLKKVSMKLMGSESFRRKAIINNGYACALRNFLI